MGSPRESQGILRNAGDSWEIQEKLREPSGIKETALPVSMYSQVSLLGRWSRFRRAAPHVLTRDSLVKRVTRDFLVKATFCSCLTRDFLVNDCHVLTRNVAVLVKPLLRTQV